MRKSWSKTSRAFTLIEIMVVVVIIGILAAVVVPRISNQAERARIKTTQASIKSVETALSVFELNAGRFPTTEEGLNALVSRPSDLTEDKWTGPYLPDPPQDGFGRGFIYRHPGEGNREYLLLSTGKDQKEGTADDLSNKPVDSSI